MEENNNKIDNNKQNTASSTTGALGSIIFMIVATIGMFILSKFFGN